MPKNTSISLGDHFTAFIDTPVAGGRYNSASDVIRAALRLLEDEQTRLGALRAALIEGEASGKSEAFDMAAFLRQKRHAVPGETAAIKPKKGVSTV